MSPSEALAMLANLLRKEGASVTIQRVDGKLCFSGDIGRAGFTAVVTDLASGLELLRDFIEDLPN